MDINTLAKTLSRLDDETQRLLANEYNWGEGKPMIYPNTDYGLSEVCQEVSVETALETTPLGMYSSKDKFVYINDNNHLISMNRIIVLWENVALWMVNYRDNEAECAWEIFNEQV